MPTLHDVPESELLDLLRSGERTAFIEIYERYWKKLLAVAYNHTKNKTFSEEIVQQVFISLWERRTVVAIESIGGYLATAVKFTVFKYRANEQRHKRILSGFKFSSVSFNDEEIDAKFLQEYINEIVEALPEKCRLVFRYSRVEHLNTREISKEMGIAEKTVESHLTRALKTVRLSLEEAGLLILLLAIFPG